MPSDPACDAVLSFFSRFDAFVRTSAKNFFLVYRGASEYRARETVGRREEQIIRQPIRRQKRREGAKTVELN